MSNVIQFPTRTRTRTRSVKLETFAIISADYIEWMPETLEGFVVEISQGERRFKPRKFSTYEEATAFAFERADRVAKSSTVDNYFYDLEDSQQQAN